MLSRFYPLIARWFEENLGSPTEPQELGWARIAEGRDTLIAAPTGSGKTLAAFLWSIDELMQAAADGALADETRVVYVSPLKALGNDIQKNLREPMREILERAERDGLELPEIRVAVRSGDTPAAERERMIRRPPHILITTPESLFIMLTAERSRGFLRTARTVIVDEIHAVAGDKRGAHLALSLERLERLADSRPQRIGLSATQKPIDEIARLLVGSDRTTEDGAPDCAVVDVGHRRDWDLSIETPEQPLGPIASHELRAEIHDRIAELAARHRSTLVFVDTRRMAERVAHELSERLGEENVAPHHGSLSRKLRLRAEQGLKSGGIPVVVATASLELGIDIGHVDLVCLIGAPRALSTLLQRVGRSGHWLGAVPKGVLFPLTRDELMQCAAAVRAARNGELDRVIFPRKPLDVLAQQIVAIAAAEQIGEENLLELVRRANPYRDLSREEFEEVVAMLSDGVATGRGRRSAHLHRDLVNRTLKGRRGARLAAITSGGAIPDTADYDVIEEPKGTFVGKVNEDFAIESIAGDVFLLGNSSWRIRRVEAGTVRVEDARGAPPTIPFWLGEAPARTAELSTAVSSLRKEIADRLEDHDGTAWLVGSTGVDRAGAEQMIEYVSETRAALGAVPTQESVVAERFFDESGGMQLVIHAPFGARINRAWGLGLRKRFCVTFDFELQAAATDDGVVLSLGEQHSFPLESVAAYLRPATLRNAVVQALLPSPMFTNRWRWNATRSLALLRQTGGRRVPMPIQRMRAEDLLAAVFPDQVACQDNRSGDITPPDHPLVNETIGDCLHEAMDLDGLADIVARLEDGSLRFLAVETPAPSPMSHEILNANPYAFLDDAPLEERRARAVALRRTDPELERGLGALDPKAVEEVRERTWPEVRDADELHDLLLSLGWLPAEEAAPWEEWARQLAADGRVAVAEWESGSGTRSAYVTAERLPLAIAAVPSARLRVPIPVPDGAQAPPESRDAAVTEVVQGWMDRTGPTTAAALADRLGLDGQEVNRALHALEARGVVLRGSFTPAADLEWCERRLLARIHRLTIGGLRREIEPVSSADLVRFLLRWQHVQPGTQLHGRDGVAHVIGQLQGLELPAPAWEETVLPARIRNYSPGDLEHLCLSGTVAWGRLGVGAEAVAGSGRGTTGRKPGQKPGRNTPIAFLLREDLHELRPPRGDAAPSMPTAAAEIASFLEERGASFLADIASATRRMPTEVEEALWELVSLGLVSGDGVAGLRMLLRRGRHRPGRPQLRAVPGRRRGPRALPVGRWALWGREGEPASPDDRVDAVARQLLRRYGVVFRELLARERDLPPWRLLLRTYRRWEAQGQIRGGRFVSGFVGEQFALPEAVDALRAVRRTPEDEGEVIVAAADPLNLVGIVLPGPRVSPLSGLSIAYRSGAAVDVAPLGELRSRQAAHGTS